MDSVPLKQRRDRMEAQARAWRVVVEHSFETETSLIALGRRGVQSVVLKLVKRPNDEWNSGRVLEAYNGTGIVRVYDFVDGAVLLERLSPGVSLTGMVFEGKDEEATEILTDVIEQMFGREPPKTCPTVEDWGKGFERYCATRDSSVPRRLVEQADRLFSHLCATQGPRKLLHGDLHHYNVLLDSTRGWLAIDPKGVVGEAEYEVGAILRNPTERPDLFASAAVVERRTRQFARRLNLDFERILAWGFAQAVLSAIWNTEDGVKVGPEDPSIKLANAIRPLLGASFSALV